MSRSIHRAALASALAVGAVGLAACGGDTNRAETTTTVTTGPTASAAAAPQLAHAPATAAVSDPARRAYVRRVDGVCRRLDSKRNAARERAAEGVDEAQGAQAYDDSIALGERQLREIEAIPVPPGESQLLRTNVFDVLHRQLQLRREMQSALGDQDVESLQVMRSQLDSLTQSLLGFARGYGFRVCGED